MGVAGCGKSSVGEAISAQIGVPYLDGDDLHPQANIDKMSSGQPLTDTDRAPWLRDVGQALRNHDGSVMIGCSALKRIYRDQIREAAGQEVLFLHLNGARAVIEARMSARDGHFMPISLLDSQFATLEPLQSDETQVIIDIDQSFDAVVQAAVAALREGD